ncbi:hypothetical protein [Terrihabitans rhizophilus]|uniref:Uncharacterized protein n=1 Tax=Terrihabitans rhizophilus TaxID=3092662 RepID=A0ABU4RQU9_9HYPH|nr:hypothetical protein [Terrihabitans sp. PJ23]MDX6807229.1 hypothetical protein [Terrihabitans sp. PJ23]
MLIDNVAEAMWNAEAGRSPETKFRHAPAEDQERFRRLATAAVAAMAHPTQDMLVRGNRALQAWEQAQHYRSPVDGIYHAMLAAEMPATQRTREVGFDPL